MKKFKTRRIQRNSHDENAEIKQGDIPKRFNDDPNVKRQKDRDARWTKKNDQKHYGYKDHIAIDNAHKLIRDYEVTSAEVHDSQVFFELLSDNSARDAWADSAYRSNENEIMLAAHTKGKRNHPLNERAKEANHKRSKIRARVEHVFGSMENEMGGMFIRVIGLARAKTKIGLMNLAYNIRRCALPDCMENFLIENLFNLGISR